MNAPFPIKPNTEVALAFLQGLDLHGRHDLVAIDPLLPKGAPGKIECATFFPGEWEQMRRWLDARQGRKNLYTSVNQARDDVPRNKRLSGPTEQNPRGDFAMIRGLVADIDAAKIDDPSGEHFRRELARLLHEVAPALSSDSQCPPTTIVESGGGLQPWWQLKQMIPATLEDRALAEGIGRTIQQRFRGDGVWDIARIMRLPGTINLPDEKKRQRGRLPALANVLLDHSSGKAYSLEELKGWAPPSPEMRSNSSSTEQVPKIDMDLVRSTASYEGLPAELRERFERARNENPTLKELWNGNPAPWQKDESGSGYAHALARILKGMDVVTPTEFGQLIWIWDHDHASAPEKIDARYITRTWARATPIGGNSGFERFEIADRTPQDTESGRSTAVVNGVGNATEQLPAWDDPADLWAGKSEPVDLPQGVVPEIVERFARDRGRRLGVEPGAPAACLITALASAIPAGNTLQMRQKDPHWTVKSILWTAIIGDSGSNKSATLDSAMRSLEAVETAWCKEYAGAKRVYDAENEAKKERSAKKAAGSSETITAEAATADDIFAGLVKPRWRRKIIKNATMEATAKLLAENPDGLLYHCDELSSMFGSMDAYKARSGADRPFWLVAKEGKNHSIDRKTSDPLIIENCAVSILGGIQPDKIKPLVPELTSDGLLQRFLPIFLKRLNDGVDDYPDKDLDETISGLAVVIAGAKIDGRFRFAPEADAELRQVQEFKNQQLARADAAPKLIEWLNKLPNEFGRLAQAFHFIRWAALPADQRGASPPEMISVETAQMARRYLTEFSYSHAWEFYGRMLGRSPSDDHATWIAEYILTRGLKKITRREIQRSYSALKGGDKHGHITVAMAVLGLHGWVSKAKRWNDKIPTEWEVNPAVHDGRFAQIAEAERVRRAGARENILREAAVRQS